MTLQTLINAWTMSGQHQSTPPATEAALHAAEAKIGTPLSPSLREVYQLFNGRWMWDLDFYQFDLNEHG